ncbi:30S ribosomal protein S2 [bacterium]|nr:30S ribosomal protein S2 [bacterium]
MSIKTTAPKKVSAKKTTAPSASALQELLQAGVHFGHKTERWHPKMAPFIHSARNGVHILDLIQTETRLKEAEKIVEQLTGQGKTVLFVATKRQAKAVVEKAAKDAGMPYVTYRWLGGMLTNWETISSRIRHLKKLEAQREDGSFDKLTKKERLLRDEETTKLSKTFGGVRDLTQLPDALFIVDIPRETIAIKEANHLKTPVIAMADTNANPEGVQYVIPANDDAVKSVALITNRIAQAASKGAAAYAAKTKSDKNEESEG